MQNTDYMKEQITVVVLNHNGISFLQKCFESIFQQTYPHLEVILVDNASQDNSIQFVSKQFPKVKIIHNKVGLGFAGGNMVGVKAATSKKVLLVSNDTWLPTDLISLLNKYYETNDYEVVAPYQGGYDGTVTDPTSSLIDPFGHHIYLDGRSRSFYLTGVCLFFEKEFYLKTQGMDEDFFLYVEDVDWFWRIQLFGYSFEYVPNTFIFHHGAGSSGGAVNQLLKPAIFMYRNRNTLATLLKNYAMPTLLIVLPIYLIIILAELLFFIIIRKKEVVAAYLASFRGIFNQLPSIWGKRKWIQKHRVISDLEILKRMYKKPAKLLHLLQFYGKKRTGFI